MSGREPADAAARREALDPTRSFIVQAPAGSGKTGLLTQRFLKLLAGVAKPEEIVAITFTKKAAAEMRNRILDALRDAATLEPAGRGAAELAREEIAADKSCPDPDSSPHRRRTRELARAVIARDAARPVAERWNLLANPQRLRIQTIDSFNAALTRQMPVLSRLGAQPRIVEDAREHHLEAARRALEPHDDLAWGEAVRVLHAHLDGDLGRARELIARMLETRDQWLWHFHGGGAGLARDELEAALERAVRAELAAIAAAVESALAPADRAALLDLLQVAASNLAGSAHAQGPHAAAVIAAAELAAAGRLPSDDPASLPVWRGLCALLLTGDDTLRKPKGIRVNEGFPSDAANMVHKARLQALLESLRAADGAPDDEAGPFATTLARIRILPPTRYDDAHWQVLGAFVEVLRHAAAMLKLVFQDSGEVDFSEVALRALAALRDEEMPTDLALALDQRISHLLVDEFQDTSKNQHELLERLTEGWAATPAGGDGRTLFLVGDPMQSIYRFRKAEVALFTRAMAEGLGGVPLTTLTLTENFRSQEGLVEWTNARFATLFPARADPVVGAVPFAPATASHAALAGPAVEVHAVLDASEGDAGATEAARVTALVQQAIAAGHESVAILVSARGHLRAIMPALKAAGITPRVTDIEPLRARPMVRDLVALTRALVHPGDRTAALAVRRAPWCGQTLAELLAGAPAPRVDAVLAAARAQHRRGPLARLVQGAWLALGGPACARDAEDLADARAYFEFLQAQEVAGDLEDPAALDELMEELYAPAAPDADARVQLLTLHKAKGLEFDTVILPGLHRLTAKDEAQLLRWLDRPGERGPELLMAALAAAGADADPIYRYVGELASQQRAAEQLRQLYVATTRPKQRLHLVGQATRTAEGVKRPPRGSLLRALWPVVGEAFAAAAAVADGEASGAPVAARAAVAARFRRLPSGWQPPVLPAASASRIAAAPVVAPYRAYSGEGQAARVIGIVVHRLLQRIAEDGLEHYAEPLLARGAPAAALPSDARTLAKRATRVASLWPAAEALLTREGAPAAARAAALAAVKQAVGRALADETGRWILSRHQSGVAEHAVSVVEGDRVVDLRLDRMFDEGGKRWIVDYKTLDEGAEETTEMLRARYRAQLERYAAAAAALGMARGTGLSLAVYLPAQASCIVIDERPAATPEIP